MKSFKVCVVGCGYVGLVTGACLSEIGHHVCCVDNDPTKIDALLAGKIPIYEAGLNALVHRNIKRKRLSFARSVQEGMKGARVIFIAVGTPPRSNGSADLKFVHQVAREIARNLKAYTVIAEKSTVPVRTGELVESTIKRYNRKHVPFDVVSNPEFLQEGTAVDDFLHPDRIVIGTPSRRAEALMKDLYAPLKARILVTDVKSAELIKHASNSFLATKISFINSVAHVCELVGADVRMVSEGMGLDPRIGRSFLYAGIGFGGFCLPKDLEAFHFISRRVGYNFQLLRIAKDINIEQGRRFIKKIKKRTGGLRGKTIAVLGIAFKPRTDDIRFSPAIRIIKRLQAQGAHVRAYDPVAMKKAEPILKNVRLCRSAYEAASGADCVALVTEWPQFKTMNLSKLKRSMKRPVLIDGRNLYDGEHMRKLGFDYHGMGRFS